MRHQGSVRGWSGRWLGLRYARSVLALAAAARTDRRELTGAAAGASFPGFHASVPRHPRAAIHTMRDELIRQIEEATDDAYRIVGETGADPSRRGFLAVERETGALVALSLTDDELRVLARLDAALPTDGSACAHCRAPLAVWVDVCPSCGARIVGDDLPGATTPDARALLLAEVKGASAGEYEVLGAMDGALGTVYFARELRGGRLVALALQAEDEEDDACSLTATWLAPSDAAPTAPLPEALAAAPAIEHVAEPLPTPTPEPRPSWLKRLLALAGLVVILLIIVTYIRGAPAAEPPAETPSTLEAPR